MEIPEHLQVAEGIARFTPRGRLSLNEATGQVGRAIAYCRDQNVARLLVDITGLTGFAPPPIGARYWFIKQWAREARGSVAVAMVARPEFVDHGKFGLMVASNVGLRGDVFTSESEALTWLLGQ